MKPVEIRKHVYLLLYLLVELSLILPMKNTIAERVLSTMNNMRNKWLNDCLVNFIGRFYFFLIKLGDFFNNIEND
jgi:hypothetical protein